MTIIGWIFAQGACSMCSHPVCPRPMSSGLIKGNSPASFLKELSRETNQSIQAVSAIVLSWPRAVLPALMKFAGVSEQRSAAGVCNARPRTAHAPITRSSADRSSHDPCVCVKSVVNAPSRRPPFLRALRRGLSSVCRAGFTLIELPVVRHCLTSGLDRPGPNPGNW